jgi:hypothetical protein
MQLALTAYQRQRFTMLHAMAKHQTPWQPHEVSSTGGLLDNLNQPDIEDEVWPSQQMIGVESHLRLCDRRDDDGNSRSIRPGHLELLTEFGL